MGGWSASTQWDAASNNLGYTPTWQMQMIAQGHHLLPWFNVPTAGHALLYADLFEQRLHGVVDLLPDRDPKRCRAKPPDQLRRHAMGARPLHRSPILQSAGLHESECRRSGWNDSKGRVAVRPGRAVAIGGNRMGVQPHVQQLQAWYPNPPLVIFISNNEASKSQWIDAEKDQHYLALYGTGQSDEFKREKVAQGWIDRYRPLQQAWRNALSSSSWRSNSKFVGYEAFGPKHFGRWSGWLDLLAVQHESDRSQSSDLGRWVAILFSDE